MTYYAVLFGCPQLVSVHMRTIGGTFKQLETAVENGYVPEEYLDTALTRQARVWMMLGMFDPPDTVPYNE
jgi:hypothetical protein